MQFLKKHYEKVILSVVLLGLTAALGFIPLRLATVQAELTKLEQDVTTKPKAPFSAPDSTHEKTLVSRLSNPIKLDFAEPHHLVNPVAWQKKTNTDGSVDYIKNESGTAIGAGALKITRISPLHFKVALENASAGNYLFGITRQNGPPDSIDPSYKEKNSRAFAKAGDVNSAPEWKLGPPYWEAATKITLTLREVDGAPENPAKFTFSRSDRPNETITVTPDKPHEEISAYEADLVYPPEGNRQFNGFRKNMMMIFAGETNNIVDIQSDKVVLSGPGGKITTITK